MLTRTGVLFRPKKPCLATYLPTYLVVYYENPIAYEKDKQDRTVFVRGIQNITLVHYA
jgi:hypothetical protein